MDILVDVFSLAKEKVKECKLANNIFALKPNQAIIKRVVDWQRQKAMAGTHKVKTLSEVSGTGKKPFKQKGTGNARFGTLRAPQRRGGAVIFGPLPRSHAIDLPKKVRKLGLYHALSAKALENKLIIVNHLELDSPKTAKLAALLCNYDSSSTLIIGGETLNLNLQLASRNLPHVTVLPIAGINVYDLLRYEMVLLSLEAVEKIQFNNNI